MDDDGTLCVIKTAKMSAQGSTPPQLTALTIGSLTLSPTFDAGTYEYTATSASASATVSATAPSGATVNITCNGDSLSNGGTATFEDGSNNIVIIVGNSTGSNTYRVTVTYES
jgi:hypothetical protein